MKLGKLHEAAIALSETSKAEMSEFFEKTNNNDELQTAMRLLYEDEKHTTKAAAQQLGERRLGVIKNLTPEESRQLDSVFLISLRKDTFQCVTYCGYTVACRCNDGKIHCLCL
jgi:hypothetical protein